MDLAAYFGFIIDNHKLAVCMEDIQKMMACRGAIIRQHPLHPKAPDWLRKGRYQSPIVVDPTTSAEHKRNFRTVFTRAGVPVLGYLYAAGVTNVLVNGEETIVLPDLLKSKGHHADDAAGRYSSTRKIALTEVQQDLAFQENVAWHEAGHAFVDIFKTEFGSEFNIRIPFRKDWLVLTEADIEKFKSLLAKIKGPYRDKFASYAWSAGRELNKAPPIIPTEMELATIKDLYGIPDDKPEHIKFRPYYDLSIQVSGFIYKAMFETDSSKIPAGLIEFLESRFPSTVQAAKFLKDNKFIGSMLSDHPEFIKRYEEDLRALLNPKTPNDHHVKGDGKIYGIVINGRKYWTDMSHYLPETFEGQKIGGEHKPDEMEHARDEAFSEIFHTVINKRNPKFSALGFFPRSAEYVKAFVAELEKRATPEERKLGAKHPIFMSSGPYSIPDPKPMPPQSYAFP